MKALLFLSVFISFYFYFLEASNAAGLTLSSNQSSINSNDEFNVNINFFISSPNGTTYYLRGAFYQTVGNYCGFTWNGSNWYNGPYSVNNSWQQLLPITVNQGSWSGQLKTRMDTSDGNCQTSGNYYFKVQRYTAGGSSSFDEQNALSLVASIPTPTPIPTSTPTLKPSDTPIPTSTPTTVKTPTPTVFKQTSPTIKITSDVLSESTKASGIKPTDKKKIDNLIESQSIDRNFLPKMLIIIGIVIILACAIVIFYPFVKEFIKNKNG